MLLGTLGSFLNKKTTDTFQKHGKLPYQKPSVSTPTRVSTYDAHLASLV